LTLSYGNKTAAPNPGFLSKAFTLLIGLGGEATPLTDYDFDRKEYVSDQENDYGPLVGISYKEDDQQLAVDIPEGLINGEVSTLTIDIPVNALEDDEDEAGTDEKGESLTFTPVGELELIKGNIVAISTGGGEQQVKWKTLEAVLTYIIDVIENLTCLFKVVLPGGKIQGFYADEDLPLVGYEPIAISVQGIDDYSALLQNGNSYAFVKNGEYVVKELNGYICPLGTELVLQVEEVVNGSLDGDAIKTDLPNEFKRSVSETLPSISSMRGLLLSQSSIPTITTTLRVVGANTETEFSTSYLQVSSGAKRVAATLPWIKNNGASPSPTFFLYIAELLSNGWEQHYSIDRYSGRNGCAIYTHVVIQDRRNNFHKSGDSIDKLRINVEIENQTYRITESLDNDNEHFYAVFESQGALSEGNNTLETASGFFPNISSWVDQPGRFYSIDSLDQANWLEIDALTVRFGISNTGFFSNIPGEYNQASAERLSNARSGYLEPPTSVYVYEIKNGIAKRWDGTVTNYNFSVTPNDNFRILVDAVRQPSSCSVELSNPQEPEFHAWGNIFPDCVVIEPRSNSTLSIVDYSFIPKDLGNANVNIYLYDVVEGDSSYRTMEIAVGQRVPGAQEEKEEWLADRYRFNIEELKWERLPNMKGKLSPVTEETDYVAPYPIPEKEAPESP
jgi:hypothetical protein